MTLRNVLNKYAEQEQEFLYNVTFCTSPIMIAAIFVSTFLAHSL